MGLIQTSGFHSWLVIFEYTLIVLSFSYVSFEVYIYVTILKQSSSEKKLKV